VTESIDKHPLRYSELAGAIEVVLMRRLHQGKLDGHVLATSIELAEIAVDFHAERPE
tara:strand:- start:2954 stop:3124 length:171 start_codon:yes stop_codon:yes gene_type:complete